MGLILQRPGLVLLAAVAAFAVWAAGQQQTGGVVVFHANAGDVLVQTNVLDKQGRSIQNLPAEDFTVFENGVKQTVNSFSHDDAPVSIGILVDNSGSMKSKRIEVDQAALNFIRTSNPQDEVFIVKFNDEYNLVAPFTNSIPDMEKGLGELDPKAGTALYDSLISAGAYLAKNGKNAKRVLLLITDGWDDASSHTLEQTLPLVQAQHAPLVYCVGLFDSTDNKDERKESEGILQQFADATGGMAYFPKRPEDVDQVTHKIAQDIRMQYSLIYHSNQMTPGFHSIHVDVKDPHMKNLTAHTRTGYTLPAAVTGGR